MQYDCSHCPNLESLKDAPKKCDVFNCCNCPKLPHITPRHNYRNFQSDWEKTIKEEYGRF